MENKSVIVVQGPATKQYVDDIKECWKGFPIIFSTWEDTPSSFFETDDMVIYNKYPESRTPMNWPLQRLSTLNGLILAKKKGYVRALKWRFDFKTNNGSGLFSLFDKEKLNYYAFVPNKYGGYITDFFMEGDIDELIDIFQVQEIGPFAERIMTDQIELLGFLDKSNFVCKKLCPEINVFWTKKNYWLDANKNFPQYGDYFY